VNATIVLFELAVLSVAVWLCHPVKADLHVSNASGSSVSLNDLQ